VISNQPAPIASVTLLLGAMVLLFGSLSPASGQRVPRIALPTTMVISRAEEHTNYRDKQVITIAVGFKTYRFVLSDAYVDDPRQELHWVDVWQEVRQFTPNMYAEGIGMDVFERIGSEDVYTVKGIFRRGRRVFEVTSVQPGPGVFAEPERR
jgi:hypothetical protein